LESCHELPKSTCRLSSRPASQPALGCADIMYNRYIYTILYYTILYYTILYYIILYYIICSRNNVVSLHHGLLWRVDEAYCTRRTCQGPGLLVRPSILQSSSTSTIPRCVFHSLGLGGKTKRRFFFPSTNGLQIHSN
jgi:hypothetical protein